MATMDLASLAKECLVDAPHIAMIKRSLSTTNVWIRDPFRAFISATFNYGGAEEDRTPDLRIANATLSQLSYRPTQADHSN